MAIDTLDKRTAAIDPMIVWRSLLPIPDGLIGSGDRMELAHVYRNAGDAGDTEVSNPRNILFLGVG